MLAYIYMLEIQLRGKKTSLSLVVVKSAKETLRIDFGRKRGETV